MAVSLVTFVLLLSFLLPIIANAQEPLSGADGEGLIGELGLADPPSAGLTVQYMFTGAANHPTAATRQIATTVHCTNFGSTDIQAEIQFFSVGAVVPYTQTATIVTNRTWTFSTQNTAVFREDTIMNTGILEQGSGRILADDPQLICTAQLLDPIGNPPAFMARLPLFDRYGHRPGTSQKLYLPLILK
ncbi:MAG: hypothetical protein KDI79_19925 [Anaerolineae bacterium]|nr:hypothetical protein [Anaerolineae bacterium]